MKMTSWAYSVIHKPKFSQWQSGPGFIWHFKI
jgi:hypothetical protein